MKKIIAILALSLLAATQSFAGPTTTGSATIALEPVGTSGYSVYGQAASASIVATSTPLIGKTSTGVGFGAQTGIGGYAMVTQHKSGTREIGGSFDSTALVYKDTAAGVVSLDTPSKSDFSAFAGWTSM